MEKILKRNSISVTELIDLYQEPFDRIFWAKYKALEKILGADFSFIKNQLLKTRKIPETLIKELDVDELTFNKITNDILDKNHKTELERKARGIEFHRQMEQNTSGKVFQYIGTDKTFNNVKSTKIIDDGFYTELQLSIELNNTGFKLVGRPDLIIKDNNSIFIVDYKTGKAIDKKSHYDVQKRKHKKMYFPLNTIIANDFNKYQLQLSLYAYLLKTLYPQFNIKELFIYHCDFEYNIETIKCQFLETAVEDLLGDLLYKLEIQRQKNLIKPINYEADNTGDI